MTLSIIACIITKSSLCTHESFQEQVFSFILTKMEVQHIRKTKDLTQENFELLFKHHFKDPNLKVTEVKHEELEKGEHYQSTMKTMIVKIQDRNDLRAKAVHQRTFDNFSCQIAKTKFGLCQRSLLVH